MTPRRIVIAGAGIGGLRTAEYLRANGFDGDILVVGAEPHLPYNRPPLSKEFNGQSLSHEALAFRQKSSVADVDWRLGRRIVHARLDQRLVNLDDGSILDYDGLVAASGVRARRLPLDDRSGRRHVIRTLDDALGLQDRLLPDAAVVVIGAGFIGCEVAAAARSLKCTVDVIDPLPSPLHAVLGPTVGGELQRRHEQHGVTFHLGRTVAMIDDERGGASRIVLDDGHELRAEVIIEAVGTVCNDEWLEGNDLDLSNGILCDNYLRPIGATGPVDHLVAVGDLARFPNPLFDDVPRRIEHWNMPPETARRAARVLTTQLGTDPHNQLDHLPAFSPMPTFWSDQYGFRLQSFGLPAVGIDDTRMLEGELDNDFAIGYYAEDTIVGVVSIGLARRLPALRSLIAGRRRNTTPA